LVGHRLGVLRLRAPPAAALLTCPSESEENP
jgi:hypothetical protein